jgi:hypothetical chaperone protein
MRRVANSFASSITDQKIQREYRQSRSANLSAAKQFRRKESIGKDEQSLFFVPQAFDNYFDLPAEGYFVKSPKSFLGARSASRTHPFLRRPCYGDDGARQNARRSALPTDTVIGRPVNFQGLNSSEKQCSGICRA